MEGDETSPKMDIPSHDTALCLIPPSNLWHSINALRCLNDKAYDKWPPHINLVYPFVQPVLLERASQILSQLDFSDYQNLSVSLETPGVFTHGKHNTIYLKPQGPDISSLAQTIRTALGWPADYSQPHLTVAQSEDTSSDAHLFTLEKARLITPLTWQTCQLAIMIRDQNPGPDGLRRMRPWKCIDMKTQSIASFDLPQDEVIPLDSDGPSKAYQRTSYQYVADTGWSPLIDFETPQDVSLDRLIIASYNVLAEFTWPPDTARNHSLISNILSRRAAADILVLQEVSDSFIPDLLTNAEMCSRYSYSTHAPAPIAGPLPSLLNIVVLSRFPVVWEYLPLQKKHKGAVVAQFPTVKFNSHPLLVAGCHLTQGFVDGALSAKKIELLRLQRYLSETYPLSAQLLVGDFNLSTSSYTIDLAQKRQVLTANGKRCLNEINDVLTNSEFQDVWLVTRVESGESSQSFAINETATNLYEGEQGATFDPLVNTTTAKLVGSGLNNRPQRYDRVLYNDKLPLHPTGFNMFGQELMEADEQGHQYYASDHWGIRCLFTPRERPDATSVTNNTKPITLHKAPASLGGIEELKQALHAQGCLPNEHDESARSAALKVLEKAISQPKNDQDASNVGLVLMPVGSYGLGVWMSSSDVDCLCIGTISAKTFFTMALQRLHKASAQGITVLRKVKATSGTMLELDVQGIKFDLQYCPATSVVERYPDIFNYPNSHPVFDLPVQTLSKLKPARDMSYLRRSIPDMAKFRVAILCIKAWAMARGIYGAKYGLLGGIHINVMLVPICKTLATYSTPVSTTDIVVTFFHHYATFDWATHLVYDPFFHKDLKYHRTAREPMCLLGWHAPALNTAMAASIPTVSTIASEIARADSLLSAPTASWDSILDSQATVQGPKDFLTTYKSYVKVDARFWGASLTRRRRFFGWLESRCVAVLVDIGRKSKALLPRIWPARFTDKEAQDETDYHASYLIGLSWADDSISKEDTKDAQSSLQAVLQSFESRLRSEERYYDPSSCWLSVSVVQASDLVDAMIDPNVYAGEYGDSDSEEDSDDEEEEDDEDEDEVLDVRTRKEKKSLAATVPKPPGMGKFRSAADAMNRIRWDMDIDESDYIIGFEDRFTGAKEKPLSQWKTEQTDEEFIPQHRILYFKQKSSGEIMWERRTRIDRIFNSGISVTFTQ